MSNNLLLQQLDNFIAKASLHEHDGYGMHHIEKRHRAMKKLSDTYNMHRDIMPHLHSEDQQLVNFIKQTLALKAHNKPYWHSRGNKILKEIQTWHDLMGKYAHSIFIESSMRKFCKDTGFDLSDIMNNIKKARRLHKEKNYQEAAKHIMETSSALRKFLNAHFI